MKIQICLKMNAGCMYGGNGDMVALTLITDSNLTQDSAGKATTAQSRLFYLKLVER